MFLKKYLLKLEVQVVLALMFGIITWVNFPDIISNISWMWDIFMKMLKVFLAPLLLFSIMTAVLWLWDMKKLWNIWARTMWYYMMTTTLAILLSLILMNVLKPWEWINFEEFDSFNSAAVEALTFSSFILSLVPDNIVQAFVELNAMQIVVMGIILWAFIMKASSKAKVLQFKSLIDTINKWILAYIWFVVKLTPFWVFAIAWNVVAKNWIDSMINLLPFAWVVLLALFIHACITLPVIWITIWKFHPYKYFLKVKKAVLLGFSTSSSSATMWVSMSVARNNAKLSKEVVDFTFPIWTTVNMDWTALYQAWVAIFVAQILWIDLSMIQQFTIVIIVILASIWAAWIPWAWILILTTVFITIWLPIEAIGIILAIDRILDMFRTWVNVWWDLVTAKVIDRFYRKNLVKQKEL